MIVHLFKSVTIKHSLQMRNIPSVMHLVLYVPICMLQTEYNSHLTIQLLFPSWILQHLLISHLILIYPPPKKSHRMEIVQFYYFWPFSAWTNAIVLLLLHWPHPSSAHLLQQGDVYLQQEEIKALLHELQICKSYTVQIDCRAHTADGVYWAAHWGPLIWNPNQDTWKTHMWLPKKSGLWDINENK